MSSDAPSEQPRFVKRGRPVVGAVNSFFSGKDRRKMSRDAGKFGSKPLDDAQLDLDELRNAFRPSKPDSLKERLRKFMHPPYIPFTSVLLAILSFSLVLSYAESWDRYQSRTMDLHEGRGAALRSAGIGDTERHRNGADHRINGATQHIEPAVFRQKGTVYHVLTGPFPSRFQAEKTCAEFAAAKQDCLVVKR